jgi:hypothetical protein
MQTNAPELTNDHRVTLLRENWVTHYRLLLEAGWLTHDHEKEPLFHE